MDSKNHVPITLHALSRKQRQEAGVLATAGAAVATGGAAVATAGAAVATGAGATAPGAGAATGAGLRRST